MEQDPMVLASHVLILPFACEKDLEKWENAEAKENKAGKIIIV